MHLGYFSMLFFFIKRGCDKQKNYDENEIK